MKKFLTTMLMIPAVTSILAQVPDKIQQSANRLWTFSLSIGGTASGGPSDDLEKAMIASGYNDPAPCYFFCNGPTIHYPFSEIGLGAIGLPWSLGLTRKIGPYFKTGIIMSNNPMGKTVGNKSTGVFLNTKYSAFTFAPVIGLTLEDIFQLGVGPAIHGTKSWSDKNGVRSTPRSNSKIGFIIFTNITFPAKSRFFFNIDFEYRHIGEVDIDPYNTGLGGSGNGIPVTTANFTHGFFSLGIGFRI